MSEVKFGERLFLNFRDIILSEINQLDVLKLCKHLIFDFFQLISRQVNCSNTRHRAKCPTTNFSDRIVTEIQSPV